MMILATPACFVAGALLGTRFSVAILLPATVLITATIFSIGILNGRNISLLIGWQIMSASALQAGYIAMTILITRRNHRHGRVASPFS